MRFRGRQNVRDIVGRDRMRTPLGRRLWDLRQDIVASGVPLLDEDGEPEGNGLIWRVVWGLVILGLALIVGGGLLYWANLLAATIAKVIG